jgi:signal transduction histidine kinase
VAYAAINDKAMSDHNRNLYLDLQDQTRQDRSLEARADQLEHTVSQLNVLLFAVVIVIILLVFLLWLFNNMYRHRKASAQSDVQEQLAVHRLHLENAQRLNLEQRAKVSLMVSITPFIDRMLHETRENQPGGLDYIRELAVKINEQNDVLTDWIQLRKGELSLHIESFPLKQLFEVIAKGKANFAIKGIELKVEPTELCVKADRVLTLFMLNTLADNARKATQPGGQVSVEAIEGADYVEISVTDTGKGLDEEQLAHLFEPKVIQDDKARKSHGFGLLNCKGIIDKYRKTSQIFQVSLLAAESMVGKGSRFFFRLPKGVVHLLLPFLLLTSVVHVHAYSKLEKAKAYADSAYFCNVNGQFLQTLLYVDSCRHELNNYYRELSGRTDTMTLMGDPSVMANEIQWFHDSIPLNYGIILDMRNEAAVAALALHEWGLYTYNNRIYTQLFKETSADSSLDDYVRTMQRSQTDKSIAIALLLFVLIAIIPAYYFLYYRRKRLMDDVEQMKEELHRIEMEEDALHISNAVLDNCLSTLKHETMYFPSRIKQLAEREESASLPEMVGFYRELYGILSLQAMRMIEGAKLHLQPLDHDILGDETLVRYLFEILRRQSGEKKLQAEYHPYDEHFVEVRVPMPKLQLSENEAFHLFDSRKDHIPYLICRQIVREHGEAIHRSDFGIKAEIVDNHTIIILKLPRQTWRNSK